MGEQGAFGFGGPSKARPPPPTLPDAGRRASQVNNPPPPVARPGPVLATPRPHQGDIDPGFGSQEQPPPQMRPGTSLRANLTRINTEPGHAPGDGARNSEGGRPVRPRRPRRPRDRPTTPLCQAESPRPCRGGRQFASPARVTTRHPQRDPSPQRERERKVTHQGYGPPPGGRGEKVGNPPPYATKPTHLLNVCGLFEVYQVGHFFSSTADAQGERDRELQGSGGRPPHPPARARSKTLSEKTSPTPNP